MTEPDDVDREAAAATVTEAPGSWLTAEEWAAFDEALMEGAEEWMEL